MNESRKPTAAPQEGAPAGKGRLRLFGFALLGISVVVGLSVAAVPFLPVATGWKVGLGTALVIAAEVAFWASAVILGREVFARYRRRLDPRNWGNGGEDSTARTGKPPTARDDDGT